MNTAKYKHIEDLAQRLIDHWLDAKWRFQWDRAKTRLGLCDFHKKTIQLSLPRTEFQSEAQIRDTLLHEIAHALAGPKAGHGPRWQHIARELGATPDRCADLSKDQAQLGARYVLKDQQGNIYKYYYRKPVRTMQRLEHSWIRGRKKQTLGQLLIEKIVL